MAHIDTPNVMIVESRFYEDVADALVEGCVSRLEEAGATYERYSVPGAFELPAAIQMAVRSMDFFTGRRRFDGYIILGCVIRGETDHYDHVCREVSRSMMDHVTRYTLALGFGLLTCETKEQAMSRASMDGRDKGGEAAEACLRMIELKRHFRLFPR